MSQDFYQAILGKLATITPFFAKPLLEAALAKRNIVAHEASPTTLIEIIKDDIMPGFETGYSRICPIQQSGAGMLIYDINDTIVFLDPGAKRLVRKALGNARITFDKLLKIGFVKPAKTCTLVEIREFRIPATPELYHLSLTPYYNHKHQLTGVTVTVKDMTLNVAIEKEVAEQNQALTDEVHRRTVAERDLKRNQEALMQSSRLVALGEMAGGIAHEINNPLTIIKSALQLNALVISQSEQLSDDLNQIHEANTMAINALNRLETTVSSMKRLFGTDNQDTFIEIALATLFADLQSLCADRMRSHTAYITFPTLTQNVMLLCRREELSHVFYSLLINALEATQDIRDTWIRIEVLQPTTPSTIIISFINSGNPLNDEQRQKIFDPFFSTKQSRHHRGLGLSVAKRIIENHDGTMTVDTKSTHTKIDIHLPLTPNIHPPTNERKD